MAISSLASSSLIDAPPVDLEDPLVFSVMRAIDILVTLELLRVRFSLLKSNCLPPPLWIILDVDSSTILRPDRLLVQLLLGLFELGLHC